MIPKDIEHATFAIVPGGSMGEAIGLLAARRGHQVNIYRRPKEMDAGEKVKFPPNVTVHSSLKETMRGADVLVLAPPTQNFEGLAREALPLLGRDTIVMSASKGLQKDTQRRPSKILEDLDPMISYRMAVMAGPNLSVGIVNNDETGTVIASYNLEVANALRRMLETSRFVVQTEQDVVGVELGGAFKNIVALAAGMFGEKNVPPNTGALYTTRLLSELVDVAQNEGAEPGTFTGLSWFGDIYLCGTDNGSRNYKAGALIVNEPTSARGFLLRNDPWLAEGVHTAGPALALARACGIYNTPTLDLINRIVCEEQDPAEAINQLMGIPPSRERTGFRSPRFYVGALARRVRYLGLGFARGMVD